MKIHIVSHTHWDREWYKPFSYFNVKLSYFFDDLFKTLKDDNYEYFMLDGQMVMIEDYLHLHPQNKQKIIDLVKDHKLIIGPWYSQPDEFAPDGESLIRNLLIGTNIAKEFGDYMKVGYLPDSFGQSAQIPHILTGCNIKSACIMRGIPTHKLNKNEFIWEGLNGDKVVTVALSKGYSNGMFLPKSNKGISMRINKSIKDLKDLGDKNHFLIMNGVDHQFPQSQIGDFIKKQENDKDIYIHSTLQNYISEINSNDLIKIKGELIYSVTNRVHTSIASTRMHQKKLNRKMERLLENSVEPLCTLAWNKKADYPYEIINSAWKSLMKNQIHDSICGCCTDEVHKDIDNVYKNIESTCTTLSNIYSRGIATAISDKELVLVIFNNSMVKGKQIIKATVFCDNDYFILKDGLGNEVEYAIDSIEQIDAATLSIWSLYLDTPCIVNKFNVSFEIDFKFNYGYKTLYIIESEIANISKNKPRILKSNIIENDFSIITINKNGTFDLFDKKTNKNFLNLNRLEDCGDAGDTYNFSPVEKDTIVDNSSVNNCDIDIKEYLNKTVAKISYEMNLPKKLSSDNLSRSEETLKQRTDTIIILYKNLKRIDIRTKINNIVLDHRMRAIFPTGINSDYSFAETQFGTIKRSNIIEGYNTWKENGWKEQPLPIYSQQKFVDVNNGIYGLAIMNRGLTEYEIYNKNDASIAITLFRGVGFLGKENLKIRPGRPSGIPIATPDAQELGEIISEYSIIVHEGNVDEAKIAKMATIYNAEATASQNRIKLTAIENKLGNIIKLFDIERLQDKITDKLHNLNKSSYEFINMNSKTLIISSLKKAENEDAIILRIYNPTSIIEKSTSIKTGFNIENVYECDFLENKTNLLKSSSQKFITNEIKGFTAQTYKIFLNT